MDVYFHLFRKNRGQTRCDLWFTKWEANTRNAVCHLLMQKPVELDWRFSKALPLGNYKGNSCFIFILLLWPDSSSVWRVSCNEAVKFVSKCLRFTENKRYLQFIFLPETAIQRWYFSLQQTDTWSCSLKRIKQTKPLVFLPLLFPLFQFTWKDPESAKGNEAGVSNSYKERSSSALNSTPKLLHQQTSVFCFKRGNA